METHGNCDEERLNHLRALLSGVEGVCERAIADARLLGSENMALRAKLAERLGDLTLCTFETAESLATSRLWIGPQPSGAGARPLAIDDGPGACAPEPPPRRAIGAPEPPRQAIGAEACDELRKVISEVSSSSNNRCAATFSSENAPPFELHSAWHEPSGKTMRRFTSQRSGGAASNILRQGVRRAGERVLTDSYWQRFVSVPSSKKRIFWDFLCVAVMAYELIVIPLQVFDWEQDLGWYIISIVTTVFWTTDMVASFFAGYHDDGVVEMRPRRVIMNYIRTWFGLDITVVSIDWAVLMVVDPATKQQFGLVRLNQTLRIVRALRLLRLLRLLRMLKVWMVIGELRSLVRSEAVLTCIGIGQLLLGVLLLNHYIACAWVGLGISQVSPDSWIKRLRMTTGHDIENAYSYSTALHWSLTQFTPASMEVVPTNTFERVFTIAVMLLAVILFSSVLSSITSSMIFLRNLTAERRKQMSYVRRYMTEKRVTLDLGNRITGYLRKYNYACSQNNKLHEEQIHAFTILPESLRSQLRCEVYLPVLDRHPLFRALNMIDEGTMVSVCNTGMSELSMSVAQEKFEVRQRATHMYVCVSGGLEYYLHHSIFPSSDVHPGAFISEAALWVTWEHKGKLVATVASELVTLNVASFHTELSRCYGQPLCQHYAARFLRRLLEWEARDDMDSISDIMEINTQTKVFVKAAHAFWADAVGARDATFDSGGSGAGTDKTTSNFITSLAARFVSKTRNDETPGGVAGEPERSSGKDACADVSA